MKYKVGDVVKVLSGSYLGLASEIGPIVHVSKSGNLFGVHLRNEDNSLAFWENEIVGLESELVVDSSIPVVVSSPLKVRIKKLHLDAKVPTYAKEGDAGLDITATSMSGIGSQVIYGTGLSFQLPENHVGLLFPRSSIYKYGLSLSNAVGVLDSKFTGEVKFIFNIIDKEKPLYEIGDRIGQMIVLPYPKVEFEEVDSLSETERGNSGFGSSGS